MNGLGQRRTASRIALAHALAAGLALLALAPDARAFCRSSTCRPTKMQECPTDESACSTTGAKLFWPSSCITYATNKLGSEALDPEETRAVIRKTFEAWSDVACPDGTTAAMTFQERDPVTCKRSEYNKTERNVNVVLFQDAKWNYRGIDGTLAKTSVTYNDVTGEIYDADIEVNTAYNEVTITDDAAKIEYDLQAILTHEVGHFIGIAHSPDPSAVMFASYSPGSTSQRKLHPDDIDAVCGTYPDAERRECTTEPRNGFSDICPEAEPKTALCAVTPGPANTSLGVAGLFIVGTIAGARARRRRKAGGGNP